MSYSQNITSKHLKGATHCIIIEAKYNNFYCLLILLRPWKKRVELFMFYLPAEKIHFVTVPFFYLPMTF